MKIEQNEPATKQVRPSGQDSFAVREADSEDTLSPWKMSYVSGERSRQVKGSTCAHEISGI